SLSVSLEGKPCHMEVDTGSALSIISWNTLKRLHPSLSTTRLQRCQFGLKDYQGKAIPVIGRGKFFVSFRAFKGHLPLVVVNGNLPTLLGLDWFPHLGLGLTGVHAVSTSDTDSLFADYADVFSEELGCYNGTPISFTVDPQAVPIRLKPRRVPFAIRPKLDAELDKLLKQGVIEPTDFANWETPIVTPLKKDGSLRICSDYKTTINKYLQVSAYPVPVIQHLLHTFEPGSIFAKLDMSQAYQQFPVDNQTAELQTIVTHRGAFRCKRLQFGVSVAPGIFQSLMERILQGLPGVVPYFDDILVSARDRPQLFQRVRAVLERFRQHGLRLKKEKCAIATRQVDFLGYKIDASGIHPLESKVRAIHEAPTPTSKTELQAFLGLLNFYASFLPLLTSEAVLIQFDPNLPLVLAADASPFGIGAVLSHRLANGAEAPIAFFSRTLSATERNYSQIDKEALAAVAAVKKFHEFLFGHFFELVTDHKPLLGLLAGDKQTPQVLSPRMTRWTLFLAAYSYKLIHRPGKTLSHADAL
ncbi:uncharacterized protein K02A2.6-like, partial [Pseudonaja textilis]|uniref:uncharacterized protein K02A2.6-like n=1 Tax=Pseudonaja textilis TaxID=8673 RepID=UPI000EA91D0F